MAKIVFFFFLFYFFLFPKELLAFKIGIVTDIHAGKNGISRKSEYNRQNKILSSRYKPLFRKVITRIRQEGGEMIFTTGDNTSEGKKVHANNLLKIAKDTKMTTFWSKGNHDGGKVAKLLFPNGNYYFTQKDNWRIIVLDSNEGENNNTKGGLGQPQMDWLRARIEETDKNILIVMHHPIFMLRSGFMDQIYPEYEELERVFSQSGKVKYVIAGHVHVASQFSKVLNGVSYFVNTPLALNKHLGGFQIIDLP